MKFQVEAPDGSKFELEGDKEPTEKELDSIFTQISSDKSRSNSQFNIQGPSAIGTSLLGGIGGLRDELIATGKQTGRDLSGVAEVGTGGLARVGAEKLGFDLPEGSLPGKVAGFIVGPGKLIRAATAPLQGIKFAGPLLRGAAEGAISGFIAPTKKGEELNLKTRQSQALIGGAIGAVAEPIVGLVSGITKFVQSTNKIKELNRAKNLIKIGKDTERIGELQGREAVLKEGLKKVKQGKTQILSEQKEIINSQLKDLSKQLKDEAETQAQNIKKPTLDYMRNFRDAWGDNFDTLLENADDVGLTVRELKEIEEDVLEELLESGIELKGDSLNSIRSFTKRAVSGATKEVKASTLLDASGNLIRKSSISFDENAVVSNLKVVQAKRAVSQSLSSGAKGQGQFSPDDLAGIIFNKKIASRLEQNIEGLSGLNHAYKLFSDLAKFVFKRLTPRSSGFEVSQGANLIKRIATGKATKGEILAVKEIEKATGIKFTGKASSIADEMNALRSAPTAKRNSAIIRIESKIAKLNQEKRRLGAGNKKKSLKLDREIQDLNDIKASVPIGHLAQRFAGGAALAAGFAAADALIGGKSRGFFTNILDAST